MCYNYVLGTLINVLGIYKSPTSYRLYFPLNVLGILILFYEKRSFELMKENKKLTHINGE